MWKQIKDGDFPYATNILVSNGTQIDIAFYQDEAWWHVSTLPFAGEIKYWMPLPELPNVSA